MHLVLSIDDYIKFVKDLKYYKILNIHINYSIFKLESEIQQKTTSLATKEASFFVGENLAKKAILKNIKTIVFDRGTKPYHGRIQKVAEGARKEGLIF